MFKTIHFALSLPLILAAALPAFAIQADDRTPVAIRQELRQLSKVRVEGSLTCKMGLENTGQPCFIKLEDPRSGRSFSFSNPNEALRMFNTGNRYVSVVGKMTGETTMEILEIAAL